MACAGNQALLPCPSNAASVQGQPFMTACSCNAGYSGNYSLCVSCNQGFYCAGGLSSPLGCTPNANSPPTSSLVTQCLCNAGYFGNYSLCSACVQGTYGPLISASACKACGPGTYAIAIAATAPAVCTACAAGKLSTSAAATACQLCPAGAYSTALASNASLCLNCSAGTYNPSTGSSSDAACILCPAGAYSTTLASSSSSTCLQCAYGTYSSAMGAVLPDTCAACPLVCLFFCMLLLKILTQRRAGHIHPGPSHHHRAGLPALPLEHLLQRRRRLHMPGVPDWHLQHSHGLLLAQRRLPPLLARLLPAHPRPHRLHPLPARLVWNSGRRCSAPPRMHGLPARHLCRQRRRHSLLRVRGRNLEHHPLRHRKLPLRPLRPGQILLPAPGRLQRRLPVLPRRHLLCRPAPGNRLQRLPALPAGNLLRPPGRQRQLHMCLLCFRLLLRLWGLHMHLLCCGALHKRVRQGHLFTFKKSLEASTRLLQ